MSTKKLSFFERLTGTIRMQDSEQDSLVIPQDSFEDADHRGPHTFSDHYQTPIHRLQQISSSEPDFDQVEPEEDIETEAELAVDVFHNDKEIVIQTMTAGIKKEHLEIILSRDEITIRGRRDNPNNSYTNEFSIQELYWGPFSRTIQLPDEVAIDDAAATEHHGLLTIRLPKFNKVRTVKLKAL